MPAHRLLPDDATLRLLRRDHPAASCPIGEVVSCSGKKHRYEEIADGYGVTKGAVYLRLSRMGETGSRASYTDLIPWKVKMEHIHGYPAMMLRLLARRQRGMSNPEAKERMLDHWLAELKAADVVVTYDPDIPLNPASPRHGGWAYVARLPEDGDSIVRADPRNIRGKASAAVA